MSNIRFVEACFLIGVAGFAFDHWISGIVVMALSVAAESARRHEACASVRSEGEEPGR